MTVITMMVIMIKVITMMVMMIIVKIRRVMKIGYDDNGHNDNC